MDSPHVSSQVRFQHNELLGARAKIQQKTREMEEAALANQENLDSIRQLAHERSLKATVMIEKQFHHRSTGTTSANQDESKTLMQQQRRREGLEREISCMMFEWELFPNLMEEKSRINMEEAQSLAQLNEQMKLELVRRGIIVQVPPLATNSSSTLVTQSGQDEKSTPMQMDEAPL